MGIYQSEAAPLNAASGVDLYPSQLSLILLLARWLPYGCSYYLLIMDIKVRCEYFPFDR